MSTPDTAQLPTWRTVRTNAEPGVIARIVEGVNEGRGWDVAKVMLDAASGFRRSAEEPYAHGLLCSDADSEAVVARLIESAHEVVDVSNDETVSVRGALDELVYGLPGRDAASVRQRLNEAGIGRSDHTATGNQVAQWVRRRTGRSEVIVSAQSATAPHDSIRALDDVVSLESVVWLGVRQVAAE